jgi:CRP/FNR family transcriptional regulator
MKPRLASENVISLDLPSICADCDVREMTLCAPLDGAEMRRLCGLLQRTEFADGDTIIDEGEPADHVFNVTGGVVRLFKLLADGRRAVTGFLFPGDFLGLTNRTTYLSSAEALGDVKLCRFPRTKLQDLFSDIPKLETRLLGMASNDLAAAQDQMVLLGRKSAGEKIASFLITLSDRQVARGVAPDPILVPMTRSDIADYLGLTTETVSRTFTQLKVKSLIRLEAGGKVVLTDRDALEDLAAGA